MRNEHFSLVRIDILIAEANVQLPTEEDLNQYLESPTVLLFGSLLCCYLVLPVQTQIVVSTSIFICHM